MMDFTKNELKIARDLIQSKRNGKICLINGASPRFLVFNEGAPFVELFIETIRKVKFFDKLPSELRDEQLLNLLVSHNIIEESDVSADFPESLRCNFTTRPDSCSIYLNLTSKCTLNCIYCFANECSVDYQPRNVPDYMPREVAFKAIESAFHVISEGGCLEVVYFGGEPMMNWSLIKECIQFCENLKEENNNKHIHHHITTNMTLFPDDFLEWIKRYGITLLIDVDGDEASHDKQRPFKNGAGSFKTIKNNLNCLKQNGVVFSLRTTVTCNNVDKMKDIASIHKELGSVSTAFPLITPFRSDGEIVCLDLIPDHNAYINGLISVYESGLFDFTQIHPLNNYLPIIENGSISHWNCGCPQGSTPLITTDGNVYPCIYLQNMDTFCMGNVLTDEYHIFDSPVLSKMKQELSIDKMNNCKKCKYRYLCGGGCSIIRIAENMEKKYGSDDIKHYIDKLVCSVTKSIIEVALWHVESILSKQSIKVEADYGRQED